jgi:hypothetical protein
MGMMVYGWSLATAGNLTTNATPNTETDAFFLKAGAGRSVGLQSVQLIGLTAISGVVLRQIKLSTASTAGTSITGQPKDPQMSAHAATMASAPTIGTTRTNGIVIGCGAAGPGGWVAPNVDSVITLSAGGAVSIDLVSASGTASLNYELSGEITE